MRYLLCTALVALTVTAPAQAHLATQSKKNDSLKTVYAKQTTNLKHSRYVCNNGRSGWRNTNWHCRAVKWLKREQQETHRRLHPPTAIPSLWYAIAMCESSLGTGAPQWHINTGNGFYGGLQFMTSTWLSYGGGKYAPRADLAAPWQQVAIASKMSLSHWPICGAPYR